MRVSQRALALALLLLALPARANTVVQGMATLSGGYNSNPTGQAVAQGDWFDEIRPGLRLTSMFERGLVYAQYMFGATLYLHQGGASGYSNDFSVGAFLVTSRTTTLTLTAGVLQSQFNNIQNLQTLGSLPVAMVPTGTSQFVTARASESIHWDFTPAWHLNETSTFSTVIPLADGLRQTYDLNNLVDIGRRWLRDGLALQLRIDYVDYSPATLMDGTVVQGQGQLLEGAAARWLHDFSPFWSTELMAGVLLAHSAENAPGLFIEPAARAAVHFRHLVGWVDLSYDHSGEPSPLTGVTLVGDQLALRGGLPLGTRSHMTLAGSLAYQRASVLDATLGTVSGSTDVLLADVGWTWAPWPEMSFFARYSFMEQMGDSTSTFVVPAFQRHLAMVGVTIVYPATAAAPVGFRGSVRANRSDAVDVPALHSPPPPGWNPPR